MKTLTSILASCILIVLMALPLCKVFSQNADQLAFQASKDYNNKKYPEAIAKYEKIIALGLESDALYYNLGDAYYRTNELAPAILYYEKALKISPNNEDIKHNIEIVKSKLTDKVEQIPELFYKHWWRQLINVVDIESYAIFSLILLSVSLLFIAIYIASRNLTFRKIAFWLGSTFAILFILCFLAVSQQYHYYTNQHEAIIFSPTVNIKSSPDENSKDIFVLHEGTNVYLMEIIGQWQEIRISNGSEGWLKASDFKKI